MTRALDERLGLEHDELRPVAMYTYMYICTYIYASTDKSICKYVVIYIYSNVNIYIYKKCAHTEREREREREAKSRVEGVGLESGVLGSGVGVGVTRALDECLGRFHVEMRQVAFVGALHLLQI